MTFTEAALEILKQEGRPMHAREIAEAAVSQKLLSHVGKTPVQTMSARISAVVTKGKGPFIRMKPGIFSLAEWKDNPPTPKERSPKSNQSQSTKQPNKRERIPAPQKKIPPEKAPREEPTAQKEAERSTKNQNRRRKKKRPDNTFEQQGSKEQLIPESQPNSNIKPENMQKPGKILEQNQNQIIPNDQVKKTTQHQESRQKNTDKPRPISLNNSKSQPDGDGAEITDKVEDFLKRQSRPIALQKIAEEFGYNTRRGAGLVEALMVTDGFEREYRGLRPRFVQHRSGWTLAEREVSGEIVSLERQAADAANRLTRLAERQVLRRVRSLHMADFVQVVTLFLRRQGFGAMNPVERGGEGEFHLSVQDRRRGGRFNTALIARRDHQDKPINESAILELRGALHHYDSMRGLMITTGVFSENARREAQIANLPPVALIDGEMLAMELVRYGIGVRERRIVLPTFDNAFFGYLGN